MAYPRPGQEAAAVEFPTGGHVQPSGDDIRVIVGDNLIPHRIIFVGPGDRVSLLFKHIPGRLRYYIYYGNAKCKAEKFDWEPQRGLILETRRYGGGNCGKWKEMQQTLKQAKEPFGRGLVSNIFHGHNPFGPSMNFVSTYKGWLYVPRDGDWEFAISSAAASFMFLDDKMLLSWPGWHGAAGDARRRTQKTLKKGLHRVAYYHVQGNATPYMVAAWRWAGTGRFEPIAGRFFIPPLRASVYEYHERGERFALDFDWRNTSEAVLGEDRWFPILAFTGRSFPKPDRSARRTWNFGDGVTSNEAEPSHVYLATGTYTVSLTMRRAGRDIVWRQKVVVNRDWWKQVTTKPINLKSLPLKIRDYPFKNMTAPALYGALLLYQELDQQESLLKVGAAIVTKLKALSEPDACEAAVIFAKALRDTAKDPAKAIQVLRLGEATVKQPELRARMILMAGDTMYYHQHKPSLAKGEYERVVRDYGGAKKYVRLSLMRLGDIIRERGQLEEARRYYLQSLEVRGERPPGRETLDMAMRSLETEEFLRRGDLPAASDSLNLWQWQQPEEKLRGQWSVLKVKYSLAKKEVAEAIEEAEVMLRVNPESQYAPELLLLLAAARRERGEEKLARAALDRLKKEYPDSPLVKVADEELKKKPTKRKAKKPTAKKP